MLSFKMMLVGQIKIEERTIMFNKILLTTLVLACGLCAATLLPPAGEGAGLSPVGSAWAAPECTDADGDGHDKYHRKWCLGGDDPDDSDPCSPVDSDPSCDGGGTGGDLGSAISLDCILVGEWGVASLETIKGDGLGVDDPTIAGTRYPDAVDKVDCSIDGPSTPWPIRLGLGVKGRPENSVRKVDVVLGDFERGGFSVTDGRLGSHVDLGEYPNLFSPPAENMDEMEPIRINVRPYRDDPDQTGDGIHLLNPGEIYEMGMRFSIPGMERTSFSIAGQWYEGNESFTGIGCETGFNNEILDNAPPFVDISGEEEESNFVPLGMQDVSVYLWLDGGDADDLPDGYTVSTGAIAPPLDASNPPVIVEGPPVITAGPRYAAVCSSIGPLAPCGNPRAPSNCNFLGYVPVQFTMHVRVK
jgi:hypothetical protein